jgi:peptidoglycan hydrolase CwlO-like protein
MKTLTDTQQQYANTGSEALPAKVKDPKEKYFSSTDSKIKNLEAIIVEQNKTIKKLQRDISRVKDQIVELAGRIPRG